LSLVTLETEFQIQNKTKEHKDILPHTRTLVQCHIRNLALKYGFT